jgi:hypothetical protein
MEILRESFVEGDPLEIGRPREGGQKLLHPTGGMN